MEQYLALTRGSQASSVVKPKIEGNVNFEIKSQFIRELMEDTFSRIKNDDAHKHVEQVLDIVSLFNIPVVSHDALMLRVIPVTLTGAAKRWVERLPIGTVDSWDLFKKAFIQSHQKVNIFYNGLGTMNCQLLDSQRPIPGMTPGQALTAIQTMADQSQKWHNGSSNRIINSSSESEGITAIVNKLESLGIVKLEPINLVIEMADNTKCTPKGIVENLLIKIHKFIFSVDFVILDMVEDLRMPVILGRPLLATAHAKKEKYSAPKEKRVHLCKAIVQEKENEHQYWASCDPNSDVCNGGDLPINEGKRYWESINDSKREELEWEKLSLNNWMKISVTSPRDCTVTYSNEDMSHHSVYNVKLRPLYAITFKFTKDDLSKSPLRHNIGDKTPTEGYEDAIVVSAITADNFKLKHGLLTLIQNKQFFGHDKEDPHAHIHYFNNITSTLKFLSVPNTLIKLMLFPFSLEGLNSKDQDFLNSAAGGNFLDKMPRECLGIIESMSKVCYSRNKPVVPKVSTTASTSGVSPDVVELKDMVRALLLDKKVCEFQYCLHLKLGTLPSNIIANPRSDLKAITTRSGMSYDGPQIQPPPSSLPSVVENKTEATKTQWILLIMETLNTSNHRQSILSPLLLQFMSQQLLRFADALILMPKFASTLKALIGNKEKFSEMARIPLNEHCSAVLLKKQPEKLGDPGKFLIQCDFLSMVECLAQADLGASINLMPYSVWKSDMSAKCIDFIDMACEEYSQEVLGFSDIILSGNPTLFYDSIVSATSPTLTPFENSDFLLEEVDTFLAVKDEPTASEFYQPYLDPEGDILILEAFLNDDPSPPPTFLEGNDKLPVIIEKDLSMEEKTSLTTVLKSHKRAIAWKLSDIKGINPEFCTHKILIEEDFEPAVQHQRKVNPKIHDVIKHEVIKLLKDGLIYPISDSPRVSPVHYVPKNGGFTVVENEDNELISTCLVTRWLKTMEVIMDDFFVFEDSFQSCLSHLDQMLKRCEDTNLCLNWEKNHFMVKEVTADLLEMELKKILIEKMEGNKMKDPPLDQTGGLRDGEKASASEYIFVEEPVQNTTQIEEPSHPVFETATTDTLDWVNPDGQQYPHNLLQPLSLILDNRGRRVIPFEHFINNDLEYFRGGASSRKYTTSVMKTKASDYGISCGLKTWCLVLCGYFYGFTVNRESALDVYSRRRIIAVMDLKIVEWHSYKHLDWISVRRKLSNLTIEERFAFNVSLRMFTGSIVIQQRTEDLQLGVESYQKRLNLTKPDTYRLMRIDEIYKFSDETLNDVRTALVDRLKGIRMQYLPQTIWRKGDKDRATAII
uniref:Reverse transcriptase domain-containing protein n=1 Tax=Tanacetum cinerariifolium TaxID=118510 RepID=A0A699GI16_TANCI|nr:hypothetical protein [Tanacetum cinerariifolium]